MLAPRQRKAAVPIIPGDKADRTGTAGILRRAAADIRRRFDGLQREVLALFAAVPIIGTNDAAPGPRTIYALSPEQLSALSAELQRAVDRWLASGREVRELFWWSRYDQEATQMGAAQSVANLTRLSAAYASSRTLQEVIWSEPYRNRLAAAQIRSMDHWTGLGATARSTLSSIIGRAVVDGKNPQAVRTEIAEALGVSKSQALGYAQTEITGVLRDSRWAEADYASVELGINLAILWTSALLSTTRASHAAKHGRAYTTSEVRDFYSRDGNRFRCHCSQTECLLDEDNRPILSNSLKSKMSAEKRIWERAAKVP